MRLRREQQRAMTRLCRQQPLYLPVRSLVKLNQGFNPFPQLCYTVCRSLQGRQIFYEHSAGPVTGSRRQTERTV